MYFYTAASFDDDFILIVYKKSGNEIGGVFDGPGTVVLGKDGAYIFR